MPSFLQNAYKTISKVLNIEKILKNAPSKLISTQCAVVYVYGKRISFISVDAGGVFLVVVFLVVLPDIFRQNLHTLAHLDAAMQ